MALDNCSSSCLICRLNNSTSRVDPRLAGVDGLVDEVVATDADGRLDRLCSESALDSDTVTTDDRGSLGSSCQGTSAAKLAGACEDVRGDGGVA